MVAGKIYFSIVRVTKRDAPKRGSCEVRISIQENAVEIFKNFFEGPGVLLRFTQDVDFKLTRYRCW